MDKFSKELSTSNLEQYPDTQLPLLLATTDQMVTASDTMRIPNSQQW